MTVVANLRNEPYLSGIYAPVADELDVADLPITGRVPEALDGVFLRNGPNPRFEPRGRYHIFDGDGMLHGVSLEGGRASYRNRWIRTRGLEVEIEAGHALYGGMANADFAGPEAVGDAGPVKNVANTHVIRHAGRILCLWEAGPPTEVTPELETLGTYDFDGALVGAMTAHPKIDPVTGELLFFGYSAIPPYLRYYAADAQGRITKRVDLDLPAPVMIHDFAVTERHAVFLDAPAVFDFAAFARGEPMLAWKPELGARIGVLPRDGGAADVVWSEIDPCYVFHFMNAWTDGDLVHVDACRLPRMDIGLDEDGATADAESWLHRFTVDLATGSARTERLAELPGDFPRIPAALEGRPYRYGYSATFSTGTPLRGEFDSVTRYDHQSATAATHVYGPGQVTGEAVFAPDPDGTAEDDGWVLSHVTDTASGSTDVVVLDAHDLGEVARVHLPRRVPFGFHGSWLPAGA